MHCRGVRHQFHRSDLPGQCEIQSSDNCIQLGHVEWLESSLRSQLASSTMLPSISTGSTKRQRTGVHPNSGLVASGTPKSSHRIILPNFSHDLIQKPPYFFIDDDFIPSL
ncbi:hypothetical protein GWK47_033754 [Chionoecetes opilio]|uniref:Uncharacterized protein n=1 Tax=Chionoecetes opilio TaxID=41210 RepID=A0A8J4YPH6_CHIOP|nr:hypothetical protein GWK47_033754 [Chionoecetes opilio]